MGTKENRTKVQTFYIKKEIASAQSTKLNCPRAQTTEHRRTKAAEKQTDACVTARDTGDAYAMKHMPVASALIVPDKGGKKNSTCTHLYELIELIVHG
jgi:hypothetical protein